jgi:hypothetical protein
MRRDPAPPWRTRVFTNGAFWRTRLTVSAAACVSLPLTAFQVVLDADGRALCHGADRRASRGSHHPAHGVAGAVARVVEQHVAHDRQAAALRHGVRPELAGVLAAHVDRVLAGEHLLGLQAMAPSAVVVTSIAPPYISRAAITGALPSLTFGASSMRRQWREIMAIGKDLNCITLRASSPCTVPRCMPPQLAERLGGQVGIDAPRIRSRW